MIGSLIAYHSEGGPSSNDSRSIKASHVCCLIQSWHRLEKLRPQLVKAKEPAVLA